MNDYRIRQVGSKFLVQSRPAKTRKHFKSGCHEGFDTEAQAHAEQLFRMTLDTMSYDEFAAAILNKDACIAAILKRYGAAASTTKPLA